MKRLATLTALLALAFPAGAGAERSILLGAEVQPSSGLHAERSPCEGCLALSGTIAGPADAVGFRAASSPYSLSYDWLLNDPCERNPQTWGNIPCPTPVYSGAVAVYVNPGWFTPATATFYVWAERPVASCHPHASVEEGNVPRPAEPSGCRQERCSPSQTVTLPATVTVGCTTPKAARHHHTRKR